MPIYLTSQAGGPAADPSLYVNQYVAPWGNNANDGRDPGRPKKTVSSAYVLQNVSGVSSTSPVSLFIAGGVDWSDGTEGLGLTAGQGCRLTGLSALPPGWLQSKASRWVGWGSTGTINFGYLASVLHWGNQVAPGDPKFGDRTDPALWITTSQTPIYMQDLAFLAYLPGRFGWQYLRDYAGEIYWKDVTSAERADGLSTFTVDGVSYTVTHMSRSSNVVTARLSMPTYAPSFPGMAGSYVTIDPGTGAGTFAAGTYTIISASLPGGTVADITYAETGANQATTPRTGATASGHFCGHGDFVEFEPAEGITEWPRTTYRVQSVTATTITVVDSSGYTGTWSSRSATVSATPNAGRFVLQDRQMNYLLTNMSTYNVGAAPWGAWLENWHLGPTWDFGSTIKEFTSFDNVPVIGNQTWLDGSELVIRDRDRGAAILCATGKKGASGGRFNDFRGSDGGFRVYASPVSTWGISISKVLQDSGTGKLRPAVEFVKLDVGQAPAIISVSEIANADANDADGSTEGPVGVDLANMFGQISLNQPGRVINAPNPARIDGPGGPWVVGEKETYSLDTETYEARNLTGVFGDGRLAGKRHDVQRQFGVVQRAAWVNRVSEDITTWTKFGDIDVTAGVETAELDGRANGYHIDGNGGGASLSWLQPTSYSPSLPTPAEGDHIVVGMFVRNPAGPLTTIGDSIFAAGFYGSGPLSWALTYVPKFGGDGEYQWVTGIAEITADQAGRTDFFFKLAPSALITIDVARVHFLYLPATDYTKNAAYDILHTFRPVPSYLQQGHAGTDVDVPLIGHGGVGDGYSYVEGVGSGQLTIVGSFSPKKYRPWLNADGTVAGYFELLDATVNP